MQLKRRQRRRRAKRSRCSLGLKRLLITPTPTMLPKSSRQLKTKDGVVATIPPLRIDLPPMVLSSMPCARAKKAHLRLYCKEVDTVLYDHRIALKAIYNRYAPKSLAKESGKDDGPMQMEEWLAFMRDLGWTDEIFVQKEQSLCFVWAQMAVTDETKQKKYQTMTFTDFLEAICRLVHFSWILFGAP